MRIASVLILSSVLMASTGCVSKGQHQRVVGSLKGQVTQMDQALQAQEEKNRALEAELESLRGRRGGAGQVAAFTGGMYRTPSGFELPAADIQKALKGAGYYAGPVDGKVGPDSREAIRNFQRDNSLTADGVCGRQTWTKLKTYLAQ